MLGMLKLSTLILTAYFTITVLTVAIVYALFDYDIKRPWCVVLVCLMWPIGLICTIIISVHKMIQYVINKIGKGIFINKTK